VEGSAGEKTGREEGGREGERVEGGGRFSWFACPKCHTSAMKAATRVCDWAVPYTLLPSRTPAISPFQAKRKLDFLDQPASGALGRDAIAIENK
jgi:hypothetical protein